MSGAGTTVLFDPEPRCVSSARHLVVTSLAEWGLDRLADEAVLCASELATNAVLHSRTPFTLALRTIPGGVRIDVHDGRPDRLPVPLPGRLDPLSSGATGRGLRLVAGMATRWGYFTTDLGKTVWAELAGARQGGPVEPLVELAVRPPGHSAPPVLFIDVPVAAAMASGFQVDDVVRELQLSPGSLSEEDRVTFHALLERSARLRLIGRQEAFRAAGQGRSTFTIELDVSERDVAAVGELVQFLGRLTGGTLLQAAPVDPEVTAMRAWLTGEVLAQHRGLPPTPFRFPPA